MRIKKTTLFAAVLICAILAAGFLWGGGYAVKGSGPDDTGAPSRTEATDSGLGTSTRESISVSTNAGIEGAQDIKSEPVHSSATENAAVAAEGKQTDRADEKNAKTKDQYLTDPVPEGKPVPVEPQDAVITDSKLVCTLSVRCDTILDHMDALDPEKIELVPADGILYPAAQVEFYEGESVFNVLLREMKKNRIHLEFVSTPIYNSAYIEGIHNLYEFDCGELSGWRYKVNGWFPNYGCSRYQLEDGDVVEWVYTCDLGRDVGGNASQGEEE